MTCDHTCSRCLWEFIGTVFVAGLLACCVVFIVFVVSELL